MQPPRQNLSAEVRLTDVIPTLPRFTQSPSEAARADLFRLFNTAWGGEGKQANVAFFSHRLEIQVCASSKAGTEDNREI